MEMRLLTVVLFLCSTFAFADENALTLEAFLSQIYEANPALQAARSRHSALENRIKPAATLEDPFVAAGIDEVPFGERRAEVFRYQISQAIPFPGKLGARKGIATGRAQAAEQDTETLRRELTVVATQYFYKAHYLDEAVALNRELRQLVETSVHSAKARYQTGEPEHHDWLLGKIELANLDVEYSRLVREQGSIHVFINELRGLPPEVAVERIAVSFDQEAHVNETADLGSQPELKALDAQLSRAESEFRLARLAYYPDFVVQAMAMEPNSGGMEQEKSNWGLMVGINVPLYSYRKQMKLAAAAEDEQRSIAMERRYLINKLNTERFNAQQQLLLARDVVRLYERDVMPATELALANAQMAYAARRMELSQYLDVIKVYRTQKLELVAALTDIELARMRIRELLSSPPLMKIAPNRPSLFGSAAMGNGMGASDPISMGGGMAAGKNAKRTVDAPESGATSGMGGM